MLETFGSRLEVFQVQLLSGDLEAWGLFGFGLFMVFFVAAIVWSYFNLSGEHDDDRAGWS